MYEHKALCRLYIFKDYAENEGADFKRYLLDKAEKDCEVAESFI